MPLRLASTILGGGFSSRVNLNLREAKGYTYGASAGARMNRVGGAIVGGALAAPGYYGPGYYGPGYRYYGRPAYYGGPGYVVDQPGCFWQQQRFWDGFGWRMRSVRVCG